MRAIMSQTKNNQIIRQWHIIQYLLVADGYVSSDNVLAYIQDLGISVTDRTIQRDLVLLSEIFPIECRKDDKPYSWRWERLPNTKKSQLNYRQAAVLTLVNNELKDFIPEDLFKRLMPLFIKAKLTLIDLDCEQVASLRNELELPKVKKPHDTPFGFIDVKPSSIYQLKQYLAGFAKLNPFAKDNGEHWQNVVKQQDIKDLQEILTSQGHVQMAGILSGLDKKLKKSRK